MGAYLYGSAVRGDFDPELSDLDLIVVTARPVDEIDFDRFVGPVRRLRVREPGWADRLDLTFVGRRTLETFRDGGGPFVAISHEEALALHRRAEDWLATWFLALDADTSIIGPPATAVFPAISFDEFLHVLETDVERFVRAVGPRWSDGRLAYCLLTVCRIRRSQETRDICSKREAAEWAAARYPQWAPLIRAAVEVRSSGERRRFSADERARIASALELLASEVVRAASRPDEGR